MAKTLSRSARAVWLTVHLVGMVGWIGVLAAALALDLGLATWPVDSTAVSQLNRLVHAVQWGVLVPSALVTVLSGYVLTTPYRARCPRWLSLKVYLATGVVAIGSVVLASHTSNPAYTGPARTAGVVVLLTALVLSVTRPNGSRPTRVTSSVGITPARPVNTGAGRHRK